MGGGGWELGGGKARQEPRPTRVGVVPFREGLGELGAEVGPFGLEGGFFDGLGGGVEFFFGDFKEVGEAEFVGTIVDEFAIDDEFGGVAFFVDGFLEDAVDGAVADDGPDVDGFLGEEAVDAVDELLEFIVGPTVADEDGVGAAPKVVAFGHAFHAGEDDGDGVGAEGFAGFELGGELASTGLGDGAIHDGVGDAGFAEAGGDGAEGIGEGGAEEDLLAAAEALEDEVEGGGDFGGVAVVGDGPACAKICGAARPACAGSFGAVAVGRGAADAVGFGEEMGIGGDGGEAEGLEAGADGGEVVGVAVVGLEVVAVGIGLGPAHGDADDVAMFWDDGFADFLFAAAEDDGGEEFPEAMDVADFGGAFDAAARLRLRLLRGAGEVALGDEEGGGEVLDVLGLALVGEAGVGVVFGAGGPPGEEEDVGEAVLDWSGGEDEAEGRVHEADGPADEGGLAFHFHAFIDDDAGEGIVAQIR